MRTITLTDREYEYIREQLEDPAYGYDESYFYHVANMLMDAFRREYPELFNI